MWNTAKNYLIIAAGAAILLLSLKTCNDRKQITQLQVENQKLTTINNAQGQKIVEQNVIQTSDKQAIKNLSDSFFNLKRKDEKKIKDVLAFYRGITKTKIDSVPIAYVDTQATKHFEDSIAAQCAQVIDYYEHTYISVPRTAKDSTTDYSVNVEIRRDSARFSVNIPDSQSIRFTTLKGGLFKKDIFGKRHFILKKQIVAQVLHTNKKIEVTGQISALYVAPPKPQWLLRAAIFTGAFILGSQM